MAVVPTNGSVHGREQYGVAVQGGIQSRAITAVRGDGNVAVALHCREDIHEGYITQRTASGDEVVAKYTVRKQVTILAVAKRLYDYVEDAEDYMEENNVGVDNFLAHDSCSEKCADILCRTCGCNLSSLCSCNVLGTVRPEKILSDPLRKARNLGVKFLFVDGLVFPLLNHIVRDLVVGGELIYTIAGLVLSIINYINADCHQAFNVLNFIFIILAALLGIASSVQALYRRNFFRRNSQRKNVEEDGITQVIDLSRTVLAELLIYPLLMCSIFNLVTSRPFETNSANNIVGLVRFALSALSFIVFVYILRLVILAGAIMQIQTARKMATRASNSTVYFLLYFFVYVMLQMIVQTFMIVLTGREIYEENLHFYDASNYTNYSYYGSEDAIEQGDSSCLPVMVSGGLWYMIVGSYLFPIIGLIMFFVVGYYWVQEFYIGIYIDMRSIAKTPGIDDIFQLEYNVKKMGRSMIQTLQKLDEKYLPQEKLSEDFDDFNRTCFCTKFGYPFKSPAMIVSCIAFLIINYLFIRSGKDISTIGTVNFFFTLFDSTGWGLVYFVGTMFGIAANAYTFLVGIVWLILIEIIIFIILMLLPCFIVLSCFCGGKNSDDD